MSEEFKEIHAGSPADEASVEKHFEYPAEVDKIRAILKAPEMRKALMHGIWIPTEYLPKVYEQFVDQLVGRILEGKGREDMWDIWHAGVWGVYRQTDEYRLEEEAQQRWIAKNKSKLAPGVTGVDGMYTNASFVENKTEGV